MRWPRWWSRRAKRRKVRELTAEIEQDKREIAETRAIVDEAVRRTNDAFIDVEQKTRLAKLEVALIRDLSMGWGHHHG